mmetsp:Transcript_114222/g.271899  ORF Transcript_114222/g.271899 Transcript_114222/m.271899 type:complete len:207 (-) Transcript_114222:143-763(-)
MVDQWDIRRSVLLVSGLLCVTRGSPLARGGRTRFLIELGEVLIARGSHELLLVFFLIIAHVVLDLFLLLSSTAVVVLHLQLREALVRALPVSNSVRGLQGFLQDRIAEGETFDSPLQDLIVSLELGVNRLNHGCIQQAFHRVDIDCQTGPIAGMCLVAQLRNGLLEVLVAIHPGPMFLAACRKKRPVILCQGFKLKEICRQPHLRS